MIKANCSNIMFYRRELCLGKTYNTAQKICNNEYLFHPQRMNSQDFAFKFWSFILHSVMQPEVKGQHLFSQFPSKQQHSHKSPTIRGPFLESCLEFHSVELGASPRSSSPIYHVQPVLHVKGHMIALEQCWLSIWHMGYLQDPGPHKSWRLNITHSQHKTPAQGPNPKPSLTNL